MPTATDREPRELIGRDREQARLRELVAGVRNGEGAALRVAGAPGVGKSALLATVAADNLTRLTATGFESEIELPFAGVEQLLHGLPEPHQTRAVALLGDGARGAPHDPATALRELATAVAAAAPLLVAVDDVQWLDPSSRTAVAYLARRAPRLGIGVVAVWSERGATDDPWPGVTELRLDDLARDAAIRLARSGGVAPAVAEALVDGVGGNPLALVQAPAALTAAQRAGRALLPDPLPTGERIERAFARRVEALAPPVRAALLLAAAGAPATLVAADLEPAEDAGLVRLGAGDGPEVAFVHPLARAAIYHSAAPSQRRAAHREVAARVAEPERSWQLALAAVAPDEDLAVTLERHGHRANGRGAPATAAAALERAAALTPDSSRAAGRTLAAAGLALVAGRPARARALLDPLTATVSEPAAHADLQLLRGVALYHAGRPREACALLEAESAAVATTDPARASALLVQACVALLGPGPLERVADLARRARELAAPGAGTIPDLIEAEVLVALGDHATARRRLAALEPELAGWDTTAPGHELLAVGGLCRLWLGDHDAAEAILTRLVELDRAAGAASALAAPLAALASLRLRRGDLPAAAECADEAAEIADTALSGFALTLALAAVAMVAAHRGDGETCRHTAFRMLSLGADLELTSTLAAAEQALGHLQLSSGDGAAAAAHLQRALAHVHDHGTRDPAFLFTHADLVEALVRAGRPADAAPVLAELEAGAERTGGGWARAAVERCHGLLGPAAEIDARLAAALAAHADPAMPFEAARTRLALGERLRRERRRADARTQLTRARDEFFAMGARGWAARAGAELAAAGYESGERAGAEPGDAAGDAEALTAREREVCALVAGGATNREAAAALFVSPRTVEHHLRQAYRKLDVRSRTELAARWRAAGEA